MTARGVPSADERFVYHDGTLVGERQPEGGVMALLTEQPSSVARPRVAPAIAPIGLFAFWCLAAFVTTCLILLSLVEGAAERRRMRARLPTPGSGLASGLKRRPMHRPVARDA